MGEDQKAAHGVSTFPLPPSRYYKAYTEENVKNGLVPGPPSPVTGCFSMFGCTFDTEEPILRPLESQGIQRLCPDGPDKLAQMKKLNHSIFVSFLDLVDILINCPESSRREEKISDLQLLFINLHHLINEFRPNQARETLRVMLELQRRQREQITADVERSISKAVTIINNCVELVRQKMDEPGHTETAGAGHHSSSVDASRTDETSMIVS
ncbi:mediator of RNA polymerase II transcription subunit 7-like [Corticium candelabrum]|uniref:mediator of RNA polymerase II transcription subunit 7-like n=1 Tax=Corticium candelabrum TaxID=121492 RepID=UPI002E253E7D|nr:mediator of RNA polymerase II transcription subunit 7-like [Corticium candelabrum]